MDLISIIVPVFNIREYIGKCVESLLNQTYENIEIILVDDGSDDGSEILCDRYDKEHSRIKAIHKKNGGLSSARNMGIDYSKGDYLLFVDGDDYISKSTIEELVRVSELNNSDLVIFNFFIDMDGVIKKNCSLKRFGNRIISKDDFWMLYYEHRMWELCVVTWNKLYKKNIFENLRFPEKKYHEDSFLIFDVINNSNDIYLYMGCLYYYVQRNGSIMHRQDIDKLFDNCEALLDRSEKFLTYGMNDFIIPSLNELPGNMILIYNYLLNSFNGNVLIKKKYLNYKAKLFKLYLRALKNGKFSFKKLINIMIFLMSEKVYGRLVKKTKVYR